MVLNSGRHVLRLRGSLEAVEIATKNERMRKNFQGKPRRLKLEQMPLRFTWATVRFC